MKRRGSVRGRVDAGSGSGPGVERVITPCALSNESQFQEVVDDLMAAIQAAIELTVPMVKPSPHSCHWWNDELSWLKKEMNHLASVLYRHHTVTDHPSHSQHTDMRNRYGLVIKRAKKQHWDTFLE